MDLMLADLIDKLPQMPWRLRFDRDCLIVLRKSLHAVTPEEGCALLLGNSGPEVRVHVVWPCCNVWRPGLQGLEEHQGRGGGGPPSRQTRFALDPREQIAAQRWGRQRGLHVVGSAHSHPGGAPRPSGNDRRWAAADGVVVIDAGSGGLAGWWMERSTPRHGFDLASPAKVYSLPLVDLDGASLNSTGLSATNSHCRTTDDGSAPGV